MFCLRVLVEPGCLPASCHAASTNETRVDLDGNFLSADDCQDNGDSQGGTSGYSRQAGGAVVRYSRQFRECEGAVHLLRQTPSLARVGWGFLPVQRTRLLFLLAAPLSIANHVPRQYETSAGGVLAQGLADYFGHQHIPSVVALTIIKRYSRGPDGRVAPAPFCSALILFDSQFAADRLYEEFQGQHFETPSSGSGGNGNAGGASGGCSADQKGSSTAGRSKPEEKDVEKACEGEDRDKGGDENQNVGPCCYLTFLDEVRFLEATDPSAPYLPTTDGDEEEAGCGEVPSCPFCVERLDTAVTGILTQSTGWLCARSANETWSGSLQCCCAALHKLRDINRSSRNTPRETEDTIRGVMNASREDTITASSSSPPNPLVLSCSCCDKTTGLWACAVCGHIGCGRYAEKHALAHARLFTHRFCLELDTGRIWDYMNDVYVHRRVVLDSHHDLVLPYHAAAGHAGAAGDQPDIKPAKIHVEETSADLSMELDMVLTSQLEYQRGQFEERIDALRQLEISRQGELQSEIDKILAKQRQLEGEISALTRERVTADKKVKTVQKRVEGALEQLDFLKEVNKSLLANREKEEPGGEAASAPSTNKAVQVAEAVAERQEAKVQELQRELEEVMSKIC